MAQHEFRTLGNTIVSTVFDECPFVFDGFLGGSVEETLEGLERGRLEMDGQYADVLKRLGAMESKVTGLVEKAEKAAEAATKKPALERGLSRGLSVHSKRSEKGKDEEEESD